MDTSSFELDELGHLRERVERLAVALVGDVHAGEDLAQESWLRLVQSGGPRDAAARVPWLRTATQRIGWNEWRSAARRRDREREVAREEALPSSSEIAEKAELCRRIGEAIDELSPVYAEALRDHYFGSLSHDEIASRDGISVNTVKSRVRRGREMLREKLERIGLGGDVHWSVAIVPLLPPGTPLPPALLPKSNGPDSGSSGSTDAGASGADAATAAKPVAASSAAGARLLIVLATVVVAAGVLVLPRLLGGTPDARVTGPEEDLAAADEGPTVEDLAVASNASEGRSAVEAPAAPEPEAAPVIPEGMAVLRGRILDWESRPVAGASIRIAAIPEWAPDVEVTRYDDPAYGRKRTHFGFEISTAEDGTFELVAPMPTAKETRFSVIPGPHLRRVGRMAGDGHTDWMPSLQAGPLEVGDIRLGPAGAVAGRVVDTSGNPVAGALVDAGLDPRRRDAVTTRTDENGRFLLAHATPGRTDVIVSAEGFGDAIIGDVVVPLGATGEMADVVVEAPLVISGTLVDGDGVPVAGQMVRCASFDERRISRAKTDDRGRFRLQLPRDEELRLQIQRRGFAPIERRLRPRRDAVDGELRLQLDAAPQMTFRVVDGESGKPIERFGFELTPPDVEPTSPRPVNRPGGLAERPARVGLERVSIVAPGFVPLTMAVAPDEEGGTVQTLRLARGAHIVGRLTLENAPVAGSTVNVQRGVVRALIDVATDTAGEPLRYFVAEPGAPSAAVTDADGVFDVTGLQSGLHRLSFRDEDGGRIQRWPLSIDADVREDLGDLDTAAAPAGTVEGRLVLPAGVPTAGLIAHLTGFPECGPLDDSGRFRFEGVPPGTYEIGWNALPGLLHESEGLGVKVVPGRSRTVELDAREYGVATVEVGVTRGGLGLAGVELRVLDAATGDETLVGVSDENGQVRGEVNALRAAALRAVDPRTGRSSDLGESFTLAPGAKLQRTIDLGP